jgi:hypothetical protein
MHPKLKARGAWAGHQGELPVIEGTLVKLTVEHLPHDRAPKPVWLWTSCPDADPGEVNRCWQAFLRRFDIETGKPQCCHRRCSSALSLVPSGSVFMTAA